MFVCNYVGKLNAAEGWRKYRHVLDLNAFVVILKGTYWFRIGDAEACQAGIGDLLYYPSGIPHEEWVAGDGPAETCYILWRCTDDDALTIEMPPLLHDSRGRIRILLGWIYEEYQAGSGSDDPCIETLFRSVLAEIQSQLQGCPHSMVAALRQHIIDNIERPLGLDDLAAVANLSKYHFLRLCKQETGQTPLQLLRTMRAERAKELLLTTNLPIKEIAGLTGFTNVYHFSRVFKACQGVNPGSFRRSIRRHTSIDSPK